MAWVLNVNVRSFSSLSPQLFLNRLRTFTRSGSPLRLLRKVDTLPPKCCVHIVRDTRRLASTVWLQRWESLVKYISVFSEVVDDLEVEVCSEVGNSNRTWKQHGVPALCTAMQLPSPSWLYSVYPSSFSPLVPVNMLGVHVICYSGACSSSDASSCSFECVHVFSPSLCADAVRSLLSLYFVQLSHQLALH